MSQSNTICVHSNPLFACKTGGMHLPVAASLYGCGEASLCV